VNAPRFDRTSEAAIEVALGVAPTGEAVISPFAE
jgi:hypothetical protein